MEENEKIEKVSDETLEEVSGGFVYPGPAPTYDGYGTYYVQYGDSLHSLSKKFGVNQHDLAVLNNINPPFILYVGQQILYPKHR